MQMISLNTLLARNEKERLKQVKREKGVAGTEILLSLVIAMFTIGVLIMSLVIIGVKLGSTSGVGSDAQTVINDTWNSLSTTTDWFPIFVVLGAVVVMIGLTAVVIAYVRSFRGGGGGGA